MATSSLSGATSNTTPSHNPFIAKLEAFGPVSEAERAFLAAISAETFEIAAGTDLVREGDAPPGVFLIMEGLACRSKVRANGARQIMAYLLPGDTGDLDVSRLKAMDHTISALASCRAVCLSLETVRAMSAYPGLANVLRMSGLVDTATLREWLVNVGRRSGLERLAHLFCELLLRYQAIGRSKEQSFPLPVTQRELADTTGQTVVHVNRILQELRTRGLIRFERRFLTVLDLPGLQALAEFKPNYLHLGDKPAA